MSAEATSVFLHGPLGDMFGKEFRLHISSAGEAIRALCALRDGFREELSKPGAHYTVLAGDASLPLEGLHLGTGGRDIHIVPVVEGAKSEGATIIAGAVLMVAGYALANYTGGGSLVIAKIGSSMMAAGLSMAIGGVYSMIAPSPSQGKPNEPPQNDPSKLFGGPVNTTAQNHPIQICYGEVEIGSAIISAMVDHSDRPKRGSGSGGNFIHPEVIAEVGGD